MGDVISEIDRPLNQTRYLISGVISLLLLIFMTLMQNRYFELRKKDMALLKVNGLSTKAILQILCHQLILGLLVVFILQFVLSYFINARQLAKLEPEEILRN